MSTSVIPPSQPSTTVQEDNPPSQLLCPQWPDLEMVLDEIEESLSLTITPTTKVLYIECEGQPIDILGWTESDFMDHDLVDFINPEDHKHFLAAVASCLQTDSEVVSYSRLTANLISNERVPIEERNYYQFIMSPGSISNLQERIERVVFVSARPLLTPADEISDVISVSSAELEHWYPKQEQEESAFSKQEGLQRHPTVPVQELSDAIHKLTLTEQNAPIPLGKAPVSV